MGSASGRAANAVANAVGLALAVAAGLRVAAFAGAFPFFSNVDEHRHVDAVLKYSRGILPSPGADGYEPEMPTWLGMYGSPEYHARSAAEVAAPPWKGSMKHTLGMIAYNERFLRGRPNLEAFSPPVYYATAGAWMALGRALGLDGGALLYWVRELAALLWAAVVFATWRFARAAYPDDAFTPLAASLLLVVFPQDALYYVTPDALSPVVGAAALFAAVAVARDPRASTGVYAAAGIFAALTFLTKYTGAVALVPCGFATLWVARRGADRARWAKLAVLWAVCALPIALWLGRNAFVHGDWLATGVKVERLGWGTSPLTAWLAHPIWSPSGAWTFTRELLTTFWRGELAWQRATLVSPLADAFYVGSSLVFVAAASLGLVRARGASGGRAADGLSLAALVAAAGVLVALSLRFAFGETTNPTADAPYLSQGRLVDCALVPFALLYARGIRAAAHRAPPRARSALAWGLLAVAIAVVVASEVSLSAAVFASEYNWFHYPG